MNLGRVIGTVVASQKYQDLGGIRLLVVQPLDSQQRPQGEPVVACDAIQSGVGDTIFYVNSREASMALEQNVVPVDAAIVGFVDAVGSDVVDHDAPLQLEREGGQ